MGKGKYLTYFLLSLYLNNSSHKVSADSAWLPDKGKYKITFSHAKIDETSSERKQERVETFQKIELMVDSLLIELRGAKKEFTTLQQSVELYNLEYNVELTPDEAKSKERELSSKIGRLNSNIDILKEILTLLSPFQQYELNTAYIEYAPRKNLSYGIDSYVCENRFVNSKYTSSKYKSITKSAGLFFKYQIFKNKSFIATIQPKVIFNKHSGFKSERIFHEMSIIGGFTKKIGKIEFFTQAAITIGGGSTRLTKKKKYYTYAYSEGAKFPYGISIVKYSKHYLNLNYGFAYKRNIYEQLSVAKKFQFGKLGSKNITTQLGYFWDYNPRCSWYKVSGTVFSLWSEI